MPDPPAAKAGKGERPVGKVEHYYPKAKAAAVGLTDDLKVGDEIHIVGHGDDVRAKVKSLQLDHAPIEAGHAGQHIGVGLAKKVHEGDDVLLVPPGSKAAAPARKPARKAARKAKAKPKARKAARKPKRAKAKRAKNAKKARSGRASKARKAKGPKRKPARKGKAKRRTR